MSTPGRKDTWDLLEAEPGGRRGGKGGWEDRWLEAVLISGGGVPLDPVMRGLDFNPSCAKDLLCALSSVT